jgi:hypothetical protein
MTARGERAHGAHVETVATSARLGVGVRAEVLALLGVGRG